MTSDDNRKDDAPPAHRLALSLIQEMAEERHILHGANADGFWNCTRGPCRKASEFLRGNLKPFCQAHAAGSAGGNVPQDCSWPFCPCDPVANQVLAAIQESGLEIVRKASTLTEVIEQARGGPTPIPRQGFA